MSQAVTHSRVVVCLRSGECSCKRHQRFRQHQLARAGVQEMAQGPLAHNLRNLDARDSLGQFYLRVFCHGATSSLAGTESSPEGRSKLHAAGGIMAVKQTLDCGHGTTTTIGRGRITELQNLITGS
jgi:hypothetical protein